uniref:Uncharacterized protein n=1 Tax=Globisporangium ultimum (strain ATCC 200006 / CBS 805.95 / DAOM BR144) TaxID=431595 RepID=K3WJ08_GLOUD
MRLARRPCVKIQYRDDALRAHFCKNAQQLLDFVQTDPNNKTMSALIARKALQYRHVRIDRIGDIDVRDPTFDVSHFFDIEWSKV